jgi:DNA gyrase subunit A
MVCVDKADKSKTILVISEKGFGKRTPLIDADGEDVYRITNRGGKGVKTINVTEKTGKLVGIRAVENSEDLIITCKSGITLRTPIANIKEAGRATQGVILIRLDADDAIAAISTIEEQDTETEIITDSAENLNTTNAINQISDDISMPKDNDTTNSDPEEPIINN